MFPWLQHAHSDQQHHIALRDHSQGAVFTWAQLNEQVAIYAARLQQQHIGCNSAVGLKGKNNLDYLFYYLAALSLGARVLGINPAFSTEKITALCQAYQVELLLDCAKPTQIFASVAEMQHISQAAYQSAQTLTLTSGSTGLPKAVVHSISQHLANAQGVCELLQFTGQSSWLLSLPLFHVSGQGIVWRWLAQGAELHLPSEHFYADCLNATHLSLVPTQAQRLLQFMAQQPQSAVKIQAVLLGGAHIPVELTQKLTALGIACYSGYGMTEMASTAFAKRCDGKAGVGKPLRGREFKLAQGEIWLRGAGLANGYWQNGKVVPFTNAEGWFQTKDLGSWDGENLHILGRADNMFISGGENIQPEEIEGILLQSDFVNQAFVVPKDDAEFGQRPVAFVEFQHEFSQSAVRNLQIWLSDKLEKFKQPVAYFPLQVSTQCNIKISRNELKQQLNQRLEQ